MKLSPMRQQIGDSKPALPMTAYQTLAIVLTGMALTAMLSGDAQAATAPQAKVPSPQPQAVRGYLPPSELPDSLALLPPPPAPGSPALALDETIAAANLALRGTARWDQAARDADVKFPGGAATFACALDAPITEQDTPRLYILLRRSVIDAGKATMAAKNHYKRPRPFMLNGQPICTPEETEAYRKNGAYPSGHGSVGWAWALILAELVPERSEAILARGLAFGDSRMVCNLHWYSDVHQGRLVGAAAVARLHAEPEFRADMEAARQELIAVRKRGLPPNRDCAKESAALAEPVPGTGR